MYKLIRPLLFLPKDPEVVHEKALSLLGFAQKYPSLLKILQAAFVYENDSLKQKLFGLEFKNPVGLAAGFDKNALALKGFAALGFGFLEMGTITKHEQPGNPRPRIFRFLEDLALINRMGFNNLGADKVALKLSNLKNLSIPLGISIGKSKITGLEQAWEDYLHSFKKFYELGDYLAVNVSSPNTPNLRQLQDKSFLIDIIGQLNQYRFQQAVSKPLLVKIAPDLSLEAIDEVLEVCKQYRLDGIIATNTTASRDGLSTKTEEAGGLSGRPLRQKSTEIIQHVHKQLPDLFIIGVGGIFTAEDAYEKVKAGASLLQIYTGLIYEGPGLVKNIKKGLVELLKRDGFKNIAEAVGVEAK